MKTDMPSVRGKVWVFGGAGYLGSAITAALDAQCQLTLCIDLESRASDFVRAAGLGRTVPVSLNTSRLEDLEAFVDEMIEQHGLPDGLVNLTYVSSAGIRLEDLTAADFSRPFVESVTSFFMLSRALAERMKHRGSGSFVHFASMYGLVPPDAAIYQAPLTPNPIDYGASKAAILQMNRYFAAHYGPSGLRFNCVVPGPFPNPQICSSHPDFIETLAGKTLLHRVGQNTEIVAPTLFLLSDGASYVTGQGLVVDGGWTTW